MEFMPWVAGVVVFVVLAAAAAFIFHRPAPTDMQRVQEISSAFNGADSQVLKATIMPGFVSFVRQDKETHETARAAMQAGRSGRFNSTICTGLVVESAQAAAQGGAPTPAGGVDNRFTINIGGGGAPAPTPTPSAEPQVQVRDLREGQPPRGTEVEEVGG